MPWRKCVCWLTAEGHRAESQPWLRDWTHRRGPVCDWRGLSAEAAVLLHDNEALFAGVKDVAASAKCLNLLEDLISTNIKKNKFFQAFKWSVVHWTFFWFFFLNSRATKTKENNLNVLKGIKTFGQITAVNKTVWVAICMGWEPQFWSQNGVKVGWQSHWERVGTGDAPLGVTVRQQSTGLGKCLVTVYYAHCHTLVLKTSLSTCFRCFARWNKRPACNWEKAGGGNRLHDSCKGRQ